MRPLGSTRPIIFGFILAIGITLTQPYLAFGAGQSSRMQEQPSFSRPVDRLQIFGVDGLGLPKKELTFSHVGWTAGMGYRS
jgi:hypothetical protein